MSLNIKNDETCHLAAELARLTGETMTGAIDRRVTGTPRQGTPPPQRSAAPS